MPAQSVQENIVNICSDTDVVLIWLRPLRDWISRVSRFDPVKNHTVIWFGHGCYPLPMLILCGDYHVWSSLYPCLQVLPLVHIQSILLRAKVVAIAAQIISKLDQTLPPNCPMSLPWPFRFSFLLKIQVTKGGKRALKCAPWCWCISLFNALEFEVKLWTRHSLMSSSFQKFVSWGRWRGAEAAPESTFSILQLQKCPSSNSSPLFSCSLTFGQMCLHQVGHNLQGFPHKSVRPIYWAPLLFLCRRDRFAAFGEFSVILIGL